MQQSKKILEALMSDGQKHLSFPGGRFNESVLKAVKEQGFDKAETALFLVPPSTGLALIVGLAETTQRAHDMAEIAYSACLVAQ